MHEQIALNCVIAEMRARASNASCISEPMLSRSPPVRPVSHFDHQTQCSLYTEHPPQAT